VNLYGFAGGDPINFSDPMGLCPEPASCVLALAGGAANLALSSANAAAVSTIAKATAAVYSVYMSITAGKEYVGITTDLARRGREHRNGPHGMEISELVAGLTKAEARGVEQVIIEARGLRKDGGDLLNQINSIASTRENYEAMKARGREILESIGFDARKKQ